MVHACILKPICQAGFLVQYYILLSIILIKNTIKKICYFIKNSGESFIWHPLESIHPHVFAHSRKLF